MTLRIALAALTSLLALALPTAAPAATLETTAGIGPASEDYVVYLAGQHERNRLTVTDSKHGVAFDDPGARIRLLKGSIRDCKFTRHRHRATCDVDRTIDLHIALGDRNDSVRFKGSNAGKLGSTSRTNVKDAAALADRYYDFEGSNTEHAYINGGAGNDVLRGTSGIDVLDGGPGRDYVDGGAGRDHIFDTPDGVPDKLFGGTGIDTVDGSTTSPVTIDLQAGTFAAGNETDKLNSLEVARGGTGNDTLLGSGGADGLFGDHGSDMIDGRGGADYLGGDLEAQNREENGAPGQDTLIGGPGDDVLDGRDSGVDDHLTPTDQLVCGDGSDRIVARQDDLADPSCESSAFGVFSGDLVIDQQVKFTPPLSTVAPVARGADGAPTYAIGCPGGSNGPTACAGHVQLERPPVTGDATQPEVLGTGDFDIAGGAKSNVTVALNAAGKAALAEPGARASVVVFEGTSVTSAWQQVLGP
jgi:Ca2+-binding RTX toxin-like protein